MTDQTARLLRNAENYLSALHGSVARHDNLAANFGCAGCELRDQIREAMAAAVSSAGPAPAADRNTPELAKHVARAIWALKSPPPHGSQHYRSGWDDGLEAAIDAARAALAAVVLPAPDQQAAEVCICGHTEQQHFEDVCITEITGCDCGDYLVPEAACEVIDRWREAAMRKTADRAAVLLEAADAVAADTQHIQYGSAADYANRHAALLRSMAREAQIGLRIPDHTVNEEAHPLDCDECGHPSAVLPAPTDQTAVLLEAADELGRMDYDTDSTDYGYDTYRDAWNGGVMDAAALLRRMAGEAQQDEAPVTTADKAEALGMTPTEYRSESHRLGEQRIREAAQWLRADVAFRVLDALDGTQPAREAQQDPTQDGAAVCSVAGCGHAELAHTVAGCRNCPRGQRAFHLFSLAAVARPGQPETDGEPTS